MTQTIKSRNQSNQSKLKESPAKEETPAKEKKKEKDTDNDSNINELVRKNIELRKSVKDSFDNIVAEILELDDRPAYPPSLLSLMRDSLARLLTHWFIHKHQYGTLYIEFPKDQPRALINPMGLISVSLHVIDLKSDLKEPKERINLSMRKFLLAKLEEIAGEQDKALTVLMRESFYLELLLYKLKRTNGRAYIRLPSGGEYDIVKNGEIFNPSPKQLQRLEQLTLANT